jgi:TetR/AcrR family transcriptional repressor of nem operon
MRVPDRQIQLLHGSPDASTLERFIPMGKSTKAATERRRAEIITSAAKLFQTRGVQNVAIPEIMADVGMTRGGFYRHFASKEDLAVRAVDQGHVAIRDLLDSIGGDSAGHDEALRTFTAIYLSQRSLWDPAVGCPSAAIVGDMARASEGSPVKSAFIKGFTDNVIAMARMGLPGDGEPTPAEMDEAVLQFSTLVGSVILARATSGSPIADQIMRVARTASGLPAVEDSAPTESA